MASPLTIAFVANVANAAQLSGVVDLKNYTACGILIPAVFDGTVVTFQMSDTSGGTYADVTDGSGGTYTVTVAAGKYVPLDPNIFLGVRFLKVKAGTVQTGARIVKIAGRLF
jgi:hypothetical protein